MEQVFDFASLIFFCQQQIYWGDNTIGAPFSITSMIMGNHNIIGKFENIEEKKQTTKQK